VGVAHRLEGDYAGAEARLLRALELFQGLETRWQIGRTLVDLGEVARARGDIAAARDHYDRALAAFEAMGAVPDAVRTRTMLQGL